MSGQKCILNLKKWQEKRVLEQAVKDRGLRERIGKQARYDAEQKYSWKANVLRILDAISYQNR
jgi:glycosyltransferase involved in cell wall biosynthesis